MNGSHQLGWMYVPTLYCHAFVNSRQYRERERETEREKEREREREIKFVSRLPKLICRLVSSDSLTSFFRPWLATVP